MSFKREGNDSSLLLNLQKRLVSDLLVSHIPSDEAKLLSNGRFTCTVCSYRPIFDTIDVLAIHRKGKKHIQNLAYYLERRSKVKSSDQSQNKLKRTSSETLTAAASSTYNSCCKKRKKPTDRKINLNLKQNNIKSSKPNADERLTSTTVSSYLNSMKAKSSFQSKIEDIKRNHNCPVKAYNINSTVCDIAPTFPIKKVDTKVNKELLEENKRQLELFRDGWKCNAEGEWVKDDEAEFDTDEETPN